MYRYEGHTLYSKIVLGRYDEYSAPPWKGGGKRLEGICCFVNWDHASHVHHKGLSSVLSLFLAPWDTLGEYAHTFRVTTAMVWRGSGVLESVGEGALPITKHSNSATVERKSANRRNVSECVCVCVCVYVGE